VASFNEKIKVVIDVVADNATSSLRKFRQGIADADTATGKFRAGATGAFDAVKANAGTLAMAGGAALIGFGVKAVGAFQDTALGAGLLRDSLGVTAEEASRLREVAEDLGIGVGTLESSFGRMLKTAGNTPGEFDAIGASIVKASDGTVDANETFLATIDALNAIEDPAERAAAASKIFGRSWQDMAELVGMGADDVRAALDSVEGGKIIDDREIERARRFRDSMDALRGVVEELSVEVGGELAGALTDLAPLLKTTAEGASGFARLLGGVQDKAESLGTVLGQVLSPWNQHERSRNQQMLDDFHADEKAAVELFDAVTDGVGTFAELRAKADELGLSMNATNMIVVEWKKQQDEAAASTSSNAEAMIEASIAAGLVDRAADDAERRVKDLAKAERDAARDAENLEEKWEALAREVSNEQAWVDLQSRFDELQSAADEAWVAVSTGADDAADKQSVYRQSIRDTKADIIAYAQEVAHISPEVTTSILAKVDEGSFAEVLRIIGTITNQTYPVLFKAKTASGKPLNAYASGTRSARPGLALVGEDGPELVEMSGGETVHSSSETANMFGGVSPVAAAGGVSYSITVNAGIGASGADVGRAVVDAIKRYERQNGTGWRAS
jgi:hypothetical protein